MKFLRFWFPVILYSGMIFYVSGLPRLDVSFEIPFLDKILHAVEYAILGFLFARALRSLDKAFLRIKMISVTTLLFVLFYAISDEWHQSFVPGRDMSLGDVAVDIVGGLLGILIFAYLYKKQMRFS